MTDTPPRLHHNITPDESGMRLDRWIKRHFPHISHSFVEKHLRQKDIRVNGQKAPSNLRLQANDRVSLWRPALETRKPQHAPDLKDTALLNPALIKTASQIGEWVLYADDHLLILNKPQGLATQGGTNITTSVDQALSLWLEPQGRKSYLVHRLDKDTSGLLLIALTPHTATQLGFLLSERKVSKTYMALGVGALHPESGFWEDWMAKRPGRAGEKMEIVAPDADKALNARCHYHTLETRGAISWVILKPETGRMHQLRLQMATHGCCVLGDGKYGGAAAHPEQRTTLHLHAQRLQFTHPHTHQLFDITAPLPGHFAQTLNRKGFTASKMDAEEPKEG